MANFEGASLWHRVRDYRLTRWWLRWRWGERCAECGVPCWLNPPSDHENWLGHRWVKGVWVEP